MDNLTTREFIEMKRNELKPSLQSVLAAIDPDEKICIFINSASKGLKTYAGTKPEIMQQGFPIYYMDDKIYKMGFSTLYVSIKIEMEVE